MPGVVSWHAIALAELEGLLAGHPSAVGVDQLAIYVEFMDLAEKELRYPPAAQSSDEGWVLPYDNGMARRRALRRTAPPMDADLVSVAAVDEGFPYGDYYYLYRQPKPGEAPAARLMVTNLWHVSKIAQFLR